MTTPVMLRTDVPRTNVGGPLFVSRGILATSCFVLWVLNFYLALEAGAKNGAAPWQVLASGLDLLGLLLAMQASDAVMPKERLPHLRAAWLVLSIGSSCCAASASTQETGLALIGANALLSGVSVLLVCHLWNLRGVIALTATTAAVSTGVYIVIPGAEPQAAWNVLFLALLPGLVGTASVLLRRDAIQRNGAGGVSARLDALTKAIEAKTSARELELASTKAQIDQLFARVAQARTVPLDPAVALEARKLAHELRRLLLEEWSDNWLTEALELEDLGGSVLVAHPADLVEELPGNSRPAILAATMLMAVGISRRGIQQRGTTPEPARRIHFFAEASSADRLRITWRISGVRKGQLPPLLWTELDALGRPQVQNGLEGCSIVLETERWRP